VLPEQTARKQKCTVYTQEKLRTGFWRLRTSSKLQTLPPGGGERITLDAAIKKFEERLSSGETFQNVAYQTDIPAQTPEEREGALLPTESPIWPIRGNNLVRKGIPGVHTPTGYCGTTLAPFAWHAEDYLMGAINYLHSGEKVWFCTEPSSYDAATKAFSDLLGKEPDHDQFLRHEAVHYGVDHLRSRKIATRCFMQKTGQWVVLYPRSYHSGFSATATLAEAVNYADQSWTPPEGYRPCTEMCHPGRDPITLEQLCEL
jgi:hypothetical protein